MPNHPRRWLPWCGAVLLASSVFVTRANASVALDVGYSGAMAGATVYSLALGPWALGVGAVEFGGAIVVGIYSDPPDTANYAVRADNPLLLASVPARDDASPEANDAAVAVGVSSSRLVQTMKNVLDTNDRLAGAQLVGTPADVANQQRWRCEFVREALGRLQTLQVDVARFDGFILAEFPELFGIPITFEELQSMRDRETAGDFPPAERELIDIWQLTTSQTAFISSQFADLTDADLANVLPMTGGEALARMASFDPASLGTLGCPCAFDTDGDGTPELELSDADEDGLCEFPESKTHLSGVLRFQADQPIEFRGNTVVEADEIIVDPGAVLRGDASRLGSLTMYAVRGDLVSRGRLDVAASDDLVMRARGALDLAGRVELRAGDRVKLEARQESLVLTPEIVDPNAFTVFAGNRLEMRAKGADGSVRIAGGRIGSARIDVITKASVSEVGAKEMRFEEGTLLTTNSAHTGLPTAGKITLDSTGRVVVSDSTLDAGYRLGIRTRRDDDDLCLSGGVTLAASAGTGKIVLTGVEGDVFDDGETTFLGLLSVDDAIVAGPCP